jgi:polysaccharide biosynthesis protein PslH
LRILYLTNGFPYPLTSGYLRHYHLIRGLSERHRIVLYSIVGGDFRAEHVEGLRAYTDGIEVFRSTGRTRSLWKKSLNRLRAVVTSRGAEAAAVRMARAVRDALASDAFDVVLLSGKRTDPVLGEVDRTPLVVDLCDATSTRLSGTLPFAAPLRRALLTAELRRVRQVERRLMAAGSHLLFASRRDRDLLLDDHVAAPTIVLPNGVDADYWRRTTPQLGKGAVIFSGAMSYPPNADAAAFLVRDIMPLVWAEEPGIRVTLVGRDPGEELRSATRDHRVAVTGFVDDMRPHLEAASVFAAPLRFAAGIQNKLLEALAMELPVVTSSVAAAGLETDDGDRPPVRIADGAHDFARQILEEVRSVEVDRTPRLDGRRYVTQRFTWDHSVRLLERALEEAVRQA